MISKYNTAIKLYTTSRQQKRRPFRGQELPPKCKVYDRRGITFSHSVNRGNLVRPPFQTFQRLRLQKCRI